MKKAGDIQSECNLTAGITTRGVMEGKLKGMDRFSLWESTVAPVLTTMPHITV